VCGTNLAAVSQALTGRIQQPNYYTPPIPHPFEIERQRAMANGVRLSMIGGGFLAWQFFNFVFSGFHSSPFKFWTFVGFILMAVGISKIIASRPPSVAHTPAPAPHQTYSVRDTGSQPVLSAPSAVSPPVPQTSELEPVGRHAPSVIEDETRHLPHSESPRDMSR
jgi:hypothetical protein